MKGKWVRLKWVWRSKPALRVQVHDFSTNALYFLTEDGIMDSRALSNYGKTWIAYSEARRSR